MNNLGQQYEQLALCYQVESPCGVVVQVVACLQNHLQSCGGFNELSGCGIGYACASSPENVVAGANGCVFGIGSSQPHLVPASGQVVKLADAQH